MWRPKPRGEPPPSVVVAVDFAPAPPVKSQRGLWLAVEIAATVAALGLAGLVIGLLLR